MPQTDEAPPLVRDPLEQMGEQTNDDQADARAEDEAKKAEQAARVATEMEQERNSERVQNERGFDEQNVTTQANLKVENWGKEVKKLNQEIKDKQDKISKTEKEGKGMFAWIARKIAAIVSIPAYLIYRLFSGGKKQIKIKGLKSDIAELENKKQKFEKQIKSVKLQLKRR